MTYVNLSILRMSKLSDRNAPTVRDGIVQETTPITAPVPVCTKKQLLTNS